MDLACGHCATTMALPLGKNFHLNADSCEISVKEG